ncbi:MAG: DUF2061 domain-containing protein [Saprospiraceae bacterium]|nr:DUF2061 domain-containing protein [Saprospiraceae bacterium]
MAIKPIAENYQEIEGVKVPMAYSVQKESPVRSIIKTISWRIIATLTTILIAYFITGDTEKAAQIGLAEVFIKLLFYYLHERAWTNVKWGKYWNKNQIIRALKLRIIKRKRRKKAIKYKKQRS